MQAMFCRNNPKCHFFSLIRIWIVTVPKILRCFSFHFPYFLPFCLRCVQHINPVNQEALVLLSAWCWFHPCNFCLCAERWKRAEMPSSRYTEQIQSFPSTSLSYTVPAWWPPPLARAVRPFAQYHAARVPYVGALENILSAYAIKDENSGIIHTCMICMDRFPSNLVYIILYQPKVHC